MRAPKVLKVSIPAEDVLPVVAQLKALRGKLLAVPSYGNAGVIDAIDAIDLDICRLIQRLAPRETS
jgi:hypothetical protein